MSPDQARMQIMVVGPFTGQSLERIAGSDDGLRWLEKASHFGPGTLLADTETAIKIFLADPEIKARMRNFRVHRALNEKNDKG